MSIPSGAGSMVAVLFTDLVGSTELLERLGDDAFEALRRTHFGLLREAVARTGGQEAKNLGDGLMVVFPSTIAAVSCAVAVQHAVRAHNERHPDEAFLLRVGIQVGEPIREEDDYFGTPVVVAKRLCDAAQGGQILTSELVQDLIGTRGGFPFRSVGPVALKGLRQPLPAVAVTWEEVPDVAPARPVVAAAAPSATGTASPPAAAAGSPAAGGAPVVADTVRSRLLTSSRTPFVGREEELERLRSAWKEAHAGRGTLVLLSGEAGVGKTRLAAELAAGAIDQGALVVYGRCHEESVVPYQPFVEALRQLVEAGAAQVPTAPEAPGALAVLLPGAGGPAAPGRETMSTDPEADRYHLFEAVAGLFVEAARRWPLLVVVDDLHWAPKPVLLLLRHLVTAIEGAPVLIVGTYRDAELTRAHPLTETLAALRRDQPHERVALRAMTRAEAAALLAARSGTELGADELAIAELLWRETEGNPFFLVEIIRHLLETGVLAQRDGRWVLTTSDVAGLDLPEGVRDVVGRRLAVLSEAGTRTLTYAAVLGREFDFDVLARMAGGDEDEVLAAVEDALGTRLVAEVPDRPEPTYAFTHALVREALLSELSLARRERLHLRAAEAIEAVHAGRTEAQAATLASHYRQAGVSQRRLAGMAEAADKTIGYALQAGHAAARVFAWEEAAAHWQEALGLMEWRETEPRRRADLLVRLSDLMYVTGFDLAQGIAYGEQALALYEQLGDDGRVAAMHCRLGRDLSSFPDTMDIPGAIAHLDAAREMLEAKPDPRAAVFMHLARAMVSVWDVRLEEGLPAAVATEETGRRFGQPGLEAAGATLHGWHVLVRGRLDEGLAVMEAAWRQADAVDHRSVAFNAAWIRGCWSTLLLDPLDAAAWLERELGRARLAQAPVQHRILRGQLAFARVVAGDLPGARRDRAEASGLVLGTSLAPPLELWAGDWAAAEAALRAERGGTEAEMRSRWEWYGLALWLAQTVRLQGDHAQADGLLDTVVGALADRGVRPMEVAARLDLALGRLEQGDMAGARAQLERIRAVAERIEEWRGLAGRVALAEGVLAWSGRDAGEGEARLAAALEVFRRFRLPWEEAEAWLWQSRLRAGAGDATGAAAGLDAALAVYDRLDAGPAWVERARSVAGG